MLKVSILVAISLNLKMEMNINSVGQTYMLDLFYQNHHILNLLMIFMLKILTGRSEQMLNFYIQKLDYSLDCLEKRKNNLKEID
jgi:hypothetical protein